MRVNEKNRYLNKRDNTHSDVSLFPRVYYKNRYLNILTFFNKVKTKRKLLNRIAFNMTTTTFNISDIPNQSGKIVLVTGGNAGLGFEIANQLLVKGAQVIIAGRSQTRVDEAVKKTRARCFR